VTNCNHSIEKISTARYKASSRLVELPTELTIEIVSRIAVQSEDAIVDLRNLRTTCKAMCVVGGAASVGRRLALKRVLRRRFYLGPEHRATLINTLANVDNTEALFQSGLHRAVLGNTRGVIMSCLDQLRRTAEAGHKESMYALSLFLYIPNSGEAAAAEARRLLRLVEGPQEGATTLPWKILTCTKHRSRIIASTWDYRLTGAIAVSPVPAPVPRHDDLQCAGRRCGHHAGWHAWYSWRRFCSEECRIRNECDWFFFTFKEALIF
jgi:hypothetical protein